MNLWQVPIIADENLVEGTLLAYGKGSLYKVLYGAQTGRIQCSTSHIRKVETWEACKEEQKPTYKKCDTCKDRFKCWTSRSTPVSDEQLRYYAMLFQRAMEKKINDS